MYNFIKNIKPNNKTNLSKISKISLNKYCFPNDNQIESKTVSLFSQPFLDSYNQCYKNIVVLNLPPKGPLAKLVRLIKFPPLSEYQQQDNFNQYGYALLSLNGYNENMEYSVLDIAKLLIKMTSSVFETYPIFWYLVVVLIFCVVSCFYFTYRDRTL